MDEIRNRFPRREKTCPERQFIQVLKNRKEKIVIPGENSNTGKASSVIGTQDRENSFKDLELDSLIREKARKYGVDEDLIRSVVKMESGGNPLATSKVGAMGLMQLMPSTAEMLGVQDPYDPEQNLEGGIRYLKNLLGKYQGREDLSLAAYHSGPSRVDRYGGIPPYPMVNHYVKCVIAMTDRAKER